MTEDIHRDIYSGMVATELAKEGYFGEEIVQYAYLTENGNINCHHDERKCVEEMLQHLWAGRLISDYVTVRKRLEYQTIIGENPLYHELQNKLLTTQKQLLTERIKQYKIKKFTNQENIVSDYLSQTHTSENSSLIKGILGWALSEKWISKSFYTEYLSKNIPTETTAHVSGKEMAGFAWWEADEIKWYSNAYLPVVWQKWRDYQKKSSLISVIIIKHYNSVGYQVKKTFEKDLLSLLDENYFKFCEKLKQS